jgi:transcriptional regulator
MLAQWVDIFESGRPKPWNMEVLPDEWLAKVAAGIVGFEIEITRLAGKFKLSQNRPLTDRQQVAAELAASPYEVEREVARLVRDRIDSA